MLAISTASVSFAPMAAALAPAVRSAGPVMGLADELGATGPLLPYWDPLGLVSRLTRINYACQPSGIATVA